MTTSNINKYFTKSPEKQPFKRKATKSSATVQSGQKSDPTEVLLLSSLLRKSPLRLPKDKFIRKTVHQIPQMNPTDCQRISVRHRPQPILPKSLTGNPPSMIMRRSQHLSGTPRRRSICLPANNRKQTSGISRTIDSRTQ